MKILLFALTDTYETVVPALEEKGHTVSLVTQYGGGFGINLYYGGRKAIAWAEEEIRRFEPDIVVNNMPSLMLTPSDDYTYFGNTKESARLELYKWETRQKARECGFELPEVVLECNHHEMQRFPYTTFLKSKYHDTWCQAWKVLPDADLDYLREVFNAEGSFPAFVERGMDFESQVYCKFRISGDSYSINGIHALCGNVDDYKVLGEAVDQDWREGCWLNDLTPDHYKVFREKCESWLDYAVTLGGNYEGTIGAGITEDLEVYWFEQNSRLNTYEDFIGDADSWLESFTKNTEENFWIAQLKQQGEQQCGE